MIGNKLFSKAVKSPWEKRNIGSNSGDGGNTGDGGKMVGGAIGAYGGEIGKHKQDSSILIDLSTIFAFTRK
nr:hypothetical protein [Tanacetum cinerariifolium]